MFQKLMGSKNLKKAAAIFMLFAFVAQPLALCLPARAEAGLVGNPIIFGSYVSAYSVSGTGTAMGLGTNASGYVSTALGAYTNASGNYSTSMGYETNASGNYSTAMGWRTNASGDASTAMGSNTNASANYSTAMGESTTASGMGSTAMGIGNTASGKASFTVGGIDSATGTTANNSNPNTASGMNAVAMGEGSTASGTDSFAMGNGANASAENAIAMGGNAQATAQNAVALGQGSNAAAQGSFAAGGGTAYTENSIAIGNSYAGGTSTGAVDSATNAIAIGNNVVASALYAAALGNDVTASGQKSIAEGYDVKAAGDTSVAIGSSSIAWTDNSVAIGAENYVGGNATKKTSGTGVAVGYKNTVSVGSNAMAFGLFNTVSGEEGVAVGNSLTAEGAHSTAIGGNSKAYTSKAIVIGDGSVAGGNSEGAITGATDAIAIGSKSTAAAQGAVVLGNESVAEGQNSLVLGNKAKAEATKSVAVGYNASATGQNSVAIGSNAVASGSNEVSVGKDGETRQITHVSSAGDIVSGGTNAVNAGDVYTEVRPTADGAYVKKASTTAANLTALDTVIGAQQSGSYIGKAGTNTVYSDLAALDTEVKKVNDSDPMKSGITKEKVDKYELYVTAAGLDANNKAVSNVAAQDLAENGTYAATTGQLYAEQKARISADTTLQTNIDNEAATRASADTALSTRIGTIDKDKNYIKEANSVSENLVILDTQAKTNATAISTEETRATGAESTLQTNITAEETRAKGAEATLQTNIDNEATARVNATVTQGAVSGDGNNAITLKNAAGTELATVDLSTLKTTQGNTLDSYFENGIAKQATKDSEGNVITATYATKTDVGTVTEDKNYIKAANSVSDNLVILDTRAKTNADAIKTINESAPMTSGIDATKVTKYEQYVTSDGLNANSNVISNVKAETLAENGTYAATTGQLYTEQQARIAATAMPLAGNYYSKGDAVTEAVKNIDTKVKANETAISAINSGDVMNSGITKAKVDKYEAYVTSTGLNANNSAVRNVAAQVIENGGTNAATTGQIYAEQEVRKAAVTGATLKSATLGADKHTLTVSENSTNVQVDLAALETTQGATNATNITAETTRATGAETTLQGNIDTLSGKVGAVTDGTYVSEASTIGANINALDTQTKANADAISAETTRATTAEGTLQTNITAETTRATAAEAEATLSSVTLGADNKTLTVAENGTSKSVDLSALETVQGANNAAAIAEETTRATTAEGTLQTNITAEETRAKAAEAEATLSSVTLGADNKTLTVAENGTSKSVDLSALETVQGANNAAAIAEETTRAKAAETAATLSSVTLDADNKTLTVAENGTSKSVDLSGLKTAQGNTLESYFTNGVANRATADASGNTITETYATKGELTTATTVTAASVQEGRYAANSAVTAAVTALDTAIGDMSGFGTQNYAKSTTSVAANLTALDTQAKANADNIGTLQSYFTDGVANEAAKATSDGQGRVISDTYAEKATTLAGYGITDAYTKSETYSKAQVDEKIGSGGNRGVAYTDDTNEEVMFTGLEGTKLSNVKKGTISAESMDAVNGSQLYAEQQARAKADTTLQTNITAEETRAKAAEQTNATAITAETTRATTAENALSTKIGTLDNDGNYIKKADSVSLNLEALDTQVAKNATAISQNTGKITTEQQTRADADTALSERIDTINNSEVMNSGITAEKVGIYDLYAKASGLSANNSAISNVAAQDLAENGTYAATTGQLYAEQKARISAVETLQTNIDNEATARVNATVTQGAVSGDGNNAITLKNAAGTELATVDLSTLKTTQGNTLDSYFENGIAKQATKDAAGNVIADTYATKTALADAAVTQGAVSGDDNNAITLKNAAGTAVATVDLSTLKTTQGNTLDSYFENGIAKQATKDAAGNVIADTYATKTEVSGTYATKTALETATTMSAKGNYYAKDESVTSALSKVDTQVKTNADNIASNTTAIGTNATAIANIVNGTTIVGNATNATNDSAGNNITSTYATKTALADAAVTQGAVSGDGNNEITLKNAAGTAVATVDLSTLKTAQGNTLDSYFENGIAKQATKDAAGNVIADTYAKSANVYAKTETYSSSEIDTKLADKQGTLSEAQLAATNSGITATKVGNYDTHIANGDIHVTAAQKTEWSGKQDALTETQLAAANSGVTAAKVGIYDLYAKAAGLSANNSVISNVDNGVADTDAATYGQVKVKANAEDVYAKTETYSSSEIDTKLGEKQGTLSEAQLAAANSGITADKVAAYDGYATTIAGKADKATTLEGYGITNAYTKSEVDTAVGVKANASDVYTKTVADSTFAAKSVESSVTALQDNFTDGAAKKAIADGAGNNISATYATNTTVKGTYKNASYADNKLTFTKVDGTTDEVSIVAGGEGSDTLAVHYDKSGDPETRQNSITLKDTAGGTTAQVAIKNVASAGALSADNNNAATGADVYNAVAGKQDSLTEAQLAAANSGITAAKVGTYDGYATTIAGKADKATTLEGYGITDAYTKSEVDTAVGVKANASEVYTKTVADSTFATKTALDDKANVSDVYTKTVADSTFATKAALTGDLSSASITTTGNATFGGNLAVTGTSAFTGLVTFNNGASMNNKKITNVANATDVTDAATYGQTAGSLTYVNNKLTLSDRNGTQIGQVTITGGGGSANAVEYDLDGETRLNSVTLKDTAGGTTSAVKITNVAAGSDDADAVNYGQIKSLLGSSTTATGTNAAAMGKNTIASGDYALATGYGNTASGKASFVAGGIGVAYNASTDKWDIEVESPNTASGRGSSAFGAGNTASGDVSFAAGLDNNASGAMAVTIGTKNSATGERAVAIGYSANSQSNNGVAIGYGSMTTKDWQSAIAIGYYANAGHFSSIAIGNHAKANGSSTVAIGYFAEATGYQSLGFGLNSHANGEYSFAVSGTTTAEAAKAIAIGASSVANSAHSVAIGSFSTTYVPVASSGATIGGTAYTFAGAATPSTWVMSVGKKGVERQIQNVAAGAVSATSTDAVNGSQLYAAYSAINSLKTTLNGVQSDVTALQNANSTPKTTSVVAPMFAMAAAPATTTAATDDANNTVTGENSTAVGNNNTVTGNDSTAYGTGQNVSGDNSGAFGDPNNVSGDRSYVFGNMTDVSGNSAYSFGNDNKISTNNTYALGSNITETVENSVVLGDNSTSTAAVATSSAEIGTMKVEGFAGSNPDGVVSVGSKGNERQIQNVAAGQVTATSTDAINGSQLYKVAEAVDNRVGSLETNVKGVTNRVGTLETNVSALDNKVDNLALATDEALTTMKNDIASVSTETHEVAAMSAALAGLHYTEPTGEEGDKFVGAVAYGGYRGKSAAAVGVAYKPSPNVMVSASTSVGNSYNSYNAGVSFKLGPGKTLNRAALQKQVKFVSEQNQALKATVQEQNAQIQSVREENAAQKAVIEQLIQRIEKLEKKK